VERANITARTTVGTPAKEEHDVIEQTTTGPIELTLPSDTRLVRIARLVASGVATAAQFDVDQLEDLRIAVDEMCSALIEGGNGPLSLTFELTEDGVEVNGRAPVDGTVELEPERWGLSRQILKVVVDDHDISQIGDELCVRLRKRRLDG
jgi:hypothetical protein